MNVMNMDLQKIYSRSVISPNTPLKYLIAIPCVNREERNAIQIIHKTFENFEKNGLFIDNPFYQLQIILFESGSKQLNYLAFLKPYLEKYPEKIKIVFSEKQLDGPKNIIRLFEFVHKKQDSYDFIIWMDDDIVVCQEFMKNADAWIRKYMNFTLFGSLYTPYQSYPIQPTPQPHCQKSFVRSYHGSCCTIFKPTLAKYILPLWFQTQKLRNVIEPDLRFRESILKFFPQIQTFLVSYPSLVQHLNIGSAIYGHKQIKKGHHARLFIGEEVDPKIYPQTLSIPKKNIQLIIHSSEENNE